MRTVVAIHGVSERRDASGFSGALRAAVTVLARKHRLGARLRWREVVWSDLSDLGGDATIASMADVVHDVIRYDRDAELRAAIVARIDTVVTTCPRPPLVVAHSLGSVAVIDWLFEEAQRSPRPWIAGLLTLGSPLGLDMPGAHFRSRVDDAHLLRVCGWLDVWAPGDPVHTGALAGVGVVSGARGLEGVGYPCRSRQLELGSHPLGAHTGYWRSPFVAAWLLDLATSGESE